MRYFFYNSNDKDKPTIVMIEEDSARVNMFPNRASTDLWSDSADEWMRYYKRIKNREIGIKERMFEICENQANKFKEKGVIPIDFDW